MTRRLGIFKRIDLSGLAENWEGCYALVRPATYDLLGELSALETDNLSEEEAIETTKRIVKDNIVGGSIKLLNDDDSLTEDTLQPDDVDQMSVEMVNHIMAEMSGQGAQYEDPKALATPANDVESQSTSKDSETTSSTDSAETSTPA